ncbi:metalloregulator ArsR/SmtB family transcription factor [Granulicatella sp. zg-ZJ]|uniref:ArsR/SmtB family transcription factor n=1 Tax=unclassified Granulicatella TaxID=2630493 RepID=UPI0013BFF6F7|nr:MULTISPECIES: metalloregulator ArsR/SmtB family transcription factor [unclassified Granulicatella]MBS4750009.1 winged helix-turn-helix transcriptional regulator [Carnobacteriaceae bacterium zg-ZUI78]NEW63066.1 metalloregulator ArsR/SmtB family transcription factor [Granulicatella sp. zg-ZJ]NEW66878.1 metalloregulator ArsR/SmtB family transcription factor [Granulicatella sp. zg-84]QMI86035.1 winged helix-turn-helix transcriptional regulator [Carnobacteriaceae bacterium zg-84]
MDNTDLIKLSRLFKIMGDPTRLRILYTLKEQEMFVNDLATTLDMSISAISHQLKTLKDAKLVKSLKQGKFVLYSLDDHHINDILEVSLNHIQEHCEHHIE